MEGREKGACIYIYQLAIYGEVAREGSGENRVKKSGGVKIGWCFKGSPHWANFERAVNFEAGEMNSISDIIITLFLCMVGKTNHQHSDGNTHALIG